MHCLQEMPAAVVCWTVPAWLCWNCWSLWTGHCPSSYSAHTRAAGSTDKWLTYL